MWLREEGGECGRDKAVDKGELEGARAPPKFSIAFYKN